MNNRIKDKFVIVAIVAIGIAGFFTTIVGAMYLANSLNTSIQRAFIQGQYK